MSGSIPPLGMAQEMNPQSPIPRKRTARDYQFGNKIGEGSYSTVFLAVDLYNNKTYAIKVLSKKHIVKEDKIKYVNIEKTTLHRLGQQHPGIVQLYYTFQDDQSLFFVLDFAEYGELLTIISKFGSLLESVLKFYMLQIIDAVKFIHLKGVIHRDLKPENILVDYNFKLKITDFGAAKLIGNDDDSQDEKINYDTVNLNASKELSDRKGSFVGTAEYVPPELLKFNECGFETDIWAIGCILFQFFNGSPPFKESTEYLTFEKIISVSYSYRNQVPPLVKDVIDLILVFEPEKRLTIPQIQSKQWFAGVPWNDREFIWNRKVPRFEPFVAQSSPPKFAAVPQFKTGSNRNINKSNSNYQLHSQIQQYDYNLVPTIGSKKLFQPPTRIKKGVPSSNSPLPQQNFVPTHRFDGTQLPQDRNFVPPPQNIHTNAWVLPQGGINPQANPPIRPAPQSNGINHKVPTQSNQAETASQNAAKAAQQNSSSVQAVEKRIANVHIGSQSKLPQVNSQVKPPQVTSANKSPQLGANKKSPQMKNLRSNTAFAKLQSYSSQSSAPPTSKPPQLNAISAAASATERILLSQSGSRPKEKHTNPAKISNANTVTFQEVSSLLKPKEKIIKLDTILKLILSNNLIGKKPGNLDINMIETLIKKHGEVLSSNMVPVVACISNMARVFLIDSSLQVMMVDLTANEGGDYLIYDYDFESVVVGDDRSDGSNGEEVYGYLILELIKEGGDLVFLKRFDETDKAQFQNPTHVVGKTGQHIVLGTNYGWIDCLVYAKQMVDKVSNEQKLKGPKISKSQTKPTIKKSTSQKHSRPGVPTTTKKSQNPSDSKTSTNKFAYAAAAAAHR